MVSASSSACGGNRSGHDPQRVQTLGGGGLSDRGRGEVLACGEGDSDRDAQPVPLFVALAAAGSMPGNAAWASLTAHAINLTSALLSRLI